MSGSFGDRRDAYLSFSITGANLKLRPGTPASYEGSWSGGPITLSGEMTVARPAGAVSNVTMSANLAGKSWGWPPAGEDGKVTGRTVSQRFNLTFTVPPNSQGSEVTGGARLDVCGGACGVYAIDFRISLSKPKPTPPVVRAFAPGGTAEPGKEVSLGFSVVDDSGRATVHLTLYQGGKQLWTAAHGPGPATGKRQAATFRLSSALVGPLSFCVWAEDAEGNKSRGSPKSSCASIKFLASCSMPKMKVLGPEDEVGDRAGDECPPEVSAIAPLGTAKPKGKVSLEYSAKDDSGRATVHLQLYEGGKKVAKQRVLPGKATGGSSSTTYQLASTLIGPLFFCVWAEDAAGNKSAESPKSSCAWIPLLVDVKNKDVSNGCGGAGWDSIKAIQNYFGNKHTYVHSTLLDPDGTAYTVDFVDACDLHDAGYAGLMVKDAINGGVNVDYRTYSRKQVDDKFYKDMVKICNRTILNPRASDARKKCTSKGGPASIGARKLHDIVREYGWHFFDADLTEPGYQQVRAKHTAKPKGGARDNFP